jgi:hypothetical protein
MSWKTGSWLVQLGYLTLMLVYPFSKINQSKLVKGVTELVNRKIIFN